MADIRFARPDDLAWCASMDPHVSERIVARKIEDQEAIIAEVGGKPVGYLRLEYLWATVPYIALIWIMPDYRRQGIGHTMLAFLETYLREKGCSVLMSSSQVNEAPAQAWHRAVGFAECGILSGINEGDIGEVFFRKRLTESV